MKSATAHRQKRYAQCRNRNKSNYTDMKNLIFIILLIPTTLFCQGWEKTYGGDGYDVGKFVQQTADGGYIITGNIWSSGNSSQDVYLIKTNSNGDTLWTKCYGSDLGDYGHSVQQTTDGGYIIAGQTWLINNVDCEVYLIKTDTSGDTIWTKTYGGQEHDQGRSVQQTTDGGYIIAGSTSSFGNGLDDIYLIKTDVNGDTLWTRTFGGEYDDWGNAVLQTMDGGYLVCGYTSSYVTNEQDVYLIKTDSNGDTLWTNSYGGVYDDIGWSVQQTTDDGYIIAGTTELIEPTIWTYEDVYLIKTDNNGDTLWTKTFGGDAVDIGYSIQQTTDGGFIISGQSDSFTNSWDSDVYLIKTDIYGDTLWTKTYGGSGDDKGWSAQQTTDGGYIITGQTLTYEKSSCDIYLIKTDEGGNISSVIEIPYPNPNRKLIKTVDLLGKEIYNPVNGIPYIEIYDDGTTKKKMNIK
jgi:hypothetical protein